MARWQAANAERLLRAARLVWPDRNPLRRAVDRAEAAILAGLAAAFLALAPLAVAVAGHVAYGGGLRAAQVQRLTRHHVPAVLMAKAVALDYSGPPEAPARWTAPDGAPRAGIVPARPGAAVGSTVLVWTDESGRLTGPPLTREQVRGQAALVAALAPAALALLFLGAGTLAHYLLARRRLAAWDAEWRATGPQWSRQR